MSEYYIVCRNTKLTDAYKAAHALDDEVDRLKASRERLKFLCRLFAKRRDEYKARAKAAGVLLVSLSRYHGVQEGRIRE